MAASGVDSLLAALSVKIAGDTADFEKALARTQNQLRDFGKQVNTDLTRAFETFDASSKKLEKGIGRVGESMVSAGVTMTKAVTAPLALVGFQAVKTAAEFEQMADVLQAQSQASAKDMEAVAAKARELGADIKLPGTSAKDALSAISELSKGGLSLAQSMEAAKGSIQLATAAQISNAQAAEIQVNALNAFSLQASEASRVSDLLAGAANQSSASITQVAEGFQAGAAVAKMAKLSISEFATSLAIMANAGIKGSDAGTSIKSMLMALLSPSNKAAGKMREIGISIFDAQGKIKPFTSIIEEFSTKLNGLSDRKRADILGTIFGSDGIRAAQLIFKEGPEGFAKMEAGISRTGSAAELAAAQNKGFLGAIDSIVSAGETFLEGAAKPFLGALTSMAQGLAEFVSNLDSLPAPVKTMIVVIAGIAAAIGPLLVAIGGMVTLIGPAIGALGGFGAILATLTGPVGLIAAGIAAMSVALVAVYSSSNSAVDSWKKQKSAVDDLEKNFNPLLARYDELKAKSNKTETEQKELNEIIKKIGTQVPTAITAFDKYGNALDISSEKAKEFVKQQQAILGIKNKEAIDEQVTNLKRLDEQIAAVQTKLKTGISMSVANLGGTTTDIKLTGEEITKLQAKLGELQNQKLGTQGFIDELKGVQKEVVATEAVTTTLTDSNTDLDNSLSSSEVELTDQQKALEKYKKELQSLVDQQTLYGDSFNFAGEKVALLEKSLVNLMENGFAPQSAFIQGLKKELDELTASFEKNKALYGSVTPVQSNVERVTSAPAGDPALPSITGEGLDKLPQALDMVQERMKLVKAAGEELGDFVQGSLSNAFGSMAEIAGGALAGGANGLRAGLQSMIDMLGDFAVQFGKKMIAIGIAMNAAIPGSGISRMIGGALLVAAGTAAKMIKIGGSKGIPALADGGITMGPTIALIGEAGREAVIPLDRLNEFMNGGGREVEIVGRMELSNKAVAWMLENAKNEGRRMG